MKTLTTNRLVLRTLKLEDLESFYHYAKKPNIGPMAGWSPHKNKDETLKILKMMIKNKEVWGITLKISDILIGTIGLHERDLISALGQYKELGYVLDEPYWGLGLIPEAVEVVLQHAFDDLCLKKVTCGHEISNVQSKRVIEKSGFHFTHNETRDDHLNHKKTISMYEITEQTYRRHKTNESIKHEIRF